MKSRVLSKVLLIFVLLISCVTSVFATDIPKLFLNGELKNVQVVLKDSSTLVPLRFCGEELQATVTWNKDTQEITITKGADNVLFTIDSFDYIHNGEVKKLLVTPKLINGTTYVPFRPLVEALDGVVLYNNENNFINIYDTDSEAYKVYKTLNSKDLTEQRFAMLESPRKSIEGIYGGNRSDTYIFPLGKSSNYFFRYYIDDTIYGMDYFEIQDGVAVQKWARTQADSNRTTEPQSPLLNYLGEGLKMREEGVFPKLDETDFVGFRNITFEASKESIESIYTIGNTAHMINNNGFSRIELSTPNKLVFSPFGSLFYLAEFDEGTFRENKGTDKIETVNLYGFCIPKKIINANEKEIATTGLPVVNWQENWEYLGIHLSDGKAGLSDDSYKLKNFLELKYDSKTVQGLMRRFKECDYSKTEFEDGTYIKFSRGSDEARLIYISSIK